MKTDTTQRPSRGAAFKETVISKAEAKGMQLIAEAGTRRAEALEAAHKQAGSTATVADVQKQLRQQHERELAAASGKASRDLLIYRVRLVNEVFKKVEDGLAQFAAGKDYTKWMKTRLKSHETDIKNVDSATLFLRPADMALAGKLSAPANVQAREDRSIALGGFRLQCGHVLFDETLDDAMEAEREAFHESGLLAL